MAPLTKLELAAEHIRGKILAGALAPGERVVIDQVARELAISPIPVREAIKQLEAEQLVTIKPHAGAVVTPLSRQDIVEVFDLLTALEEVAVRHAARNRSEAQLAECARLVGTMDTYGGGARHREWVDTNIDFHLAIAAAANMPLLLGCTRQALSRWQRIRLTLFELEAGEDPAAVNREHAAMVAALEARDEAALEDLIRRHNDSARSHYLRAGRSDVGS